MSEVGWPFIFGLFNFKLIPPSFEGPERGPAFIGKLTENLCDLLFLFLFPKQRIRREIATEIKQYFDVIVNPETLKSRILRIVGSNEPPQAIPQEHKESGENQSPEPEIKAPRKHRATGETEGGQRDGWGRKPKSDRKGVRSKARQQIVWEMVDRESSCAGT